MNRLPVCEHGFVNMPETGSDGKADRPRTGSRQLSDALRPRSGAIRVPESMVSIISRGDRICRQSRSNVEGRNGSMRNQFWKRMNRAPSYPCALCVLKTRGGRTPMAYLWRITDYAAIGVSKNPEQADCHAKSCRFAGLHVVLPHRWKGVAAQSSMDTALVVISGETIQLPVQRLQQTHTADERSRLWPRRNRTQ